MTVSSPSLLSREQLSPLQTTPGSARQGEHLSQDACDLAVQQMLVPALKARRSARPRRTNGDPRTNLKGIGTGFKWTAGSPTPDLAIQFFVARKLRPSLLAPEHVLPATWQGFPTDVLEIGGFSALGGGLRVRARPGFSGCSIGAVSGIKRTVGSIGAIVRSTRPDESDLPPMLLSCSHVLSGWEQFPRGTRILQPAVEDHGEKDSDTIARVHRLAPLTQAKHGRVDAAVAVIVGPGLVAPGFGGALPPLSSPQPMEASRGQPVAKLGRTTVNTTGEVFSFGTYEMNTREPRIGAVLLEDQILIRGEGKPFSAEGDSGALIVDPAARRAVGLLCASNDLGTFSIANRISNVLSALDIELLL